MKRKPCKGTGKANLNRLEEIQKELFKKQCDLDIQKAMVKHFIKKEKEN